MVITAPDSDWLRTFSRTLVESGLATSAQNYAPVISIDRWRRESTSGPRTGSPCTQDKPEVPEIVALARKHHPSRGARHLSQADHREASDSHPQGRCLRRRHSVMAYGHP